MPNYDYHCSNCGYSEEIYQKMTDAALTTCPNCGKETFRRAITGGAGVLYKGEGWYVTDYSKTSSGGKDKDSAPPPAPATEKTTPVPAPAKTESKPETEKK